MNLNIIDKNIDEKFLLSGLKNLGDLIDLDDESIYRGNHPRSIFSNMIGVAEVAQVDCRSDKLRFKAVNVIKLYVENQNASAMKSVLRMLFEQDIRRVIMVALNTMTCLDYYHVSLNNCFETIEFTEDFKVVSS
jgi:hypothetical protein